MSIQSDAIKYFVGNGKFKVNIIEGTIIGPKGKILNPIILDPNPKRNRRVEFKGYYYVSAYYDKKNVVLPVHKIVAYAKYGEIALKKGLHIDHINRDSLDNRGVNLRVVTPKQNAANRPLVDMRKLNQEDIDTISEMLRKGYNLLDIAYSYNVNPATINNALQGKGAYATFNTSNKTAKNLSMANFWRDVDSGMRNRQLREKYGLSYSTLSRRLSRQSGR